MKKTLSILLTLVLIIGLFTGCAEKTAETSNSNSETEAELENTVKVGLIQLVEHPSLDEIRESFSVELNNLAEEKGYSILWDYQNAQGDSSLINSICRKFVDEDVDIIVAIATPAAQGAANVTKDIPIIFSAVTDPVAAGLVETPESPTGNITGVSDYIDVQKIFQLAENLTPEVKSYGLIYNKSEVNSVSVINETKDYLDSKGIAYTEKTVTNSGEVNQVSKILLESNDAVFAPIDNTVASAMQVLAAEGIKAGKPVYVAADSMVNDGGLATVGVNYTELGKLTAEMTLKVIEGTPVSDIPVAVMNDVKPVINPETAEALGIDVSKYTD